MSLPQSIKKILNGNDQVLVRPSQVYGIATTTIFTIAGGAIWLKLMGAFVTAAAGGATTLTQTANGIATDNGAAAVVGGIGTVILSPLNGGSALLPAAAVPRVVGATTGGSFIVGTSAGGLITAVVAGATLTCEFFIVFQKLSPGVRVY